MGRINMGRVILGGLVAGLVVNIGETILNLFVIGSQMEAVLKAHNLPPVENQAIAGFVVLCFLLGILTVWVYAASRPRFGPGVGTAVKVALAVFYFAFLFPQAGNVLLGIFPPGLTIVALAWGLGELVLGSIAGAWVYSE